MSYECQSCGSYFTGKQILKVHQTTAKYCLKLRGEKSIFKCEDCYKIFTSKFNLTTHKKSCKVKNLCVRSNIKILKEELSFAEKNIQFLIEENERRMKMFYEIIISEKVDPFNAFQKFQQEIEDKQIRIKYLENKYIKKRRRKKYPRNVVYILTTPSLKEKKVYILGKTVNLTTRLSTYNKTEEHEVIHYVECIDMEIMGIVEILTFRRLDNYRECANRERFILPENEEISLFTKVIEECKRNLENS